MTKTGQRGRPRKYDWSELFSCTSFVLASGEDYLCNDASMEQQVRNAAAAREINVNIVKLRNGLLVCKVKWANAEFDSGIYAIVNLVDGKRYIGSARSFEKRWRFHRVRLRKGTHPTRELQEAWKEFGEESFKFQVLERCPPCDARNRESIYMWQGYVDDYYNGKVWKKMRKRCRK